MAGASPPIAWDAPQVLIENTGDHGLQVNQTTVAELQKVTKPVAVVAIVGLYRTGKSYLMNLLADKKNSQTGFDLGATVQSKTKGIWIWVVPHPSKQDWQLVLMDTEGLGDVEKGSKNHDVWVFALATLLSSSLVYNSIGKIDQGALDDLHFVTEMADHIKVKTDTDEEDGTTYDQFFPKFVWALRDFTLELEVDGEHVTPDGYLEHALKLKKGISKKVMDYNFPRECIRRYFSSRKCFCFPQPVFDRNKLKDLDNVCDKDLDPEFLKQSQEFKTHIFRETTTKTVQGIKLNGRTFAGMAEAYVQAIQNGAVPCIESAVIQTSKIENARAIEDSVAFYTQTMLNAVHLPTNTVEELSALHHEVEKQAIAVFLKLSIFDDDQKFQKQLITRLQAEYESLCQQNELQSQQVCEQLLQQLHAKVLDNTKKGVYATPGGYEIYKQDMATLQNQYNQAPGKGIMAQGVLHAFMQNQESMANSILLADKKLGEEQKKAEKAQAAAKKAEREVKAKKEETQKLQMEMADRQKSYDENMRQLQAKMSEDEQNLRKELDGVLTQKLEEQSAMLTQGFQEKADGMSQEISSLKNQMANERRSEPGILGKIASGFFSIFGL